MDPTSLLASCFVTDAGWNFLKTALRGASFCIYCLHLLLWEEHSLLHVHLFMSHFLLGGENKKTDFKHIFFFLISHLTIKKDLTDCTASSVFFFFFNVAVSVLYNNITFFFANALLCCLVCLWCQFWEKPWQHLESCCVITRYTVSHFVLWFDQPSHHSLLIRLLPWHNHFLLHKCQLLSHH